MRWSIICLIWVRELRDQLRDRRTLFMIAVLPLLLYPILGFAVLQFAIGFQDKPSVIGIVQGPKDAKAFPERIKAGTAQPEYMPLIVDGQFSVFDEKLLARVLEEVKNTEASKNLSAAQQEEVARKAAAQVVQRQIQIRFLDSPSLDPLNNGEVGLLLSAPSDFMADLERDEAKTPGPHPKILIRMRNDDVSRQALNRLDPILQSWGRELIRTRQTRTNTPAGFFQPFDLDQPDLQKASVGASLFDLFVRIFPFMLVMWALAGALYPAVDLCAGEKERGTMETLLISPAGREEIVLGKFLTIWVFSAGTSFLNLISMGLTTWQFSSRIPTGALSAPAIFWCVVLVLPLSAFFSAISLALGAYARSSKEGQYYLMPLFLVTMPLVFLTLAPGVQLNGFYSLVPITGVALLMQRLMTAVSLSQVPWLYFTPVLLPIVLYSWLALRWAIDQFHREEVLFREAERIDVGLWFRRLFREKEETPSSGEAFFLFGMIIFLRWLSLSFGAHLPGIVHTGVSLLAFVAMPTLMMALMLNTKPAEGLSLRWPQWGEVGVAAGLAILLLPPLAALAQTVFAHFENLTRLLQERQPIVEELLNLNRRDLFVTLLIFGALPAVCEELAFRGYILTGLLKRYRPRTAILLSSFLFALFHMNVFQFLPSFFLGVVLGLLTVRSKSLFPAMVFHFLHNSLLIAGMYVVKREPEESIPDVIGLFWGSVIGVCVVLGAGTLWWLYRKPYIEASRAP
jgi:sodium transport system permease protein